MHVIHFLVKSSLVMLLFFSITQRNMRLHQRLDLLKVISFYTLYLINSLYPVILNFSSSGISSPSTFIDGSDENILLNCIIQCFHWWFYSANHCSFLGTRRILLVRLSYSVSFRWHACGLFHAYQKKILLRFIWVECMGTLYLLWSCSPVQAKIQSWSHQAGEGRILFLPSFIWGNERWLPVVDFDIAWSNRPLLVGCHCSMVGSLTVWLCCIGPDYWILQTCN